MRYLWGDTIWYTASPGGAALMGGWFQVRPTFELDIEIPPTVLMRHLLTHRELPSGVRLVGRGEYGEVHLPGPQQRFWSPHLAYSISDAGGHSHVHCRFAPRHHIWSAVWAGYLICAFTAFFGLIGAASQWMVGVSPWGLWIASGAVICFIALSLAAMIGQQLSADQMTQLREQFERLIGDAR